MLIHEIHVFDDLTFKNSRKSRMSSLMLIEATMPSSISRIAFYKISTVLEMPKLLVTHETRVGAERRDISGLSMKVLRRSDYTLG